MFHINDSHRGCPVCWPWLANERPGAVRLEEAPVTAKVHPVTPDGRYFVVRGRLWRRSDPHLAEEQRARLVRELMAARRAVRAALKADDDMAGVHAHAAVDACKRALGERGPAWWNDGAPDLNRHMARTTPYASWFAGLPNREA